MAGGNVVAQIRLAQMCPQLHQPLPQLESVVREIPCMQYLLYEPERFAAGVINRALADGDYRVTCILSNDQLFNETH